MAKSGPRTIKMGMTWAQAVEIYMLALENGNAEGKEMAKEELRRMAKLLDQIAEEQEAEKDADDDA